MTQPRNPLTHSPLERFRRSGGWAGPRPVVPPRQPGQSTPAPRVESDGQPEQASDPSASSGMPSSPGQGAVPTRSGIGSGSHLAAVPSQGTHLSPHAVAVPALASNVRPALVLREREARGLLAEARRHDVGVGGHFSAGPAGIQVWSGPFDGPGGSHGSAVHLGSVDWIYDTPVRYYATIYRAMVTAQGIAVQHTPHTILESVLRLTGLTVEGTRLTMPMPPPRDPFRRRASGA